MKIDRNSFEVNRLETNDNGDLIDLGKIQTQHINFSSYYNCTDDEFLDYLINDLEETLEKIKDLKNKGRIK